MTNQKGFAVIPIIIIAVVLIAGGVSGYLYLKNKNKVVVCPPDTKQCLDGSYVSRIPPKCEFAECPSITTFDIKNFLDEIEAKIKKEDWFKSLALYETGIRYESETDFEGFDWINDNNERELIKEYGYRLDLAVSTTTFQELINNGEEAVSKLEKVLSEKGFKKNERNTYFCNNEKGLMYGGRLAFERGNIKCVIDLYTDYFKTRFDIGCGDILERPTPNIYREIYNFFFGKKDLNSSKNFRDIVLPVRVITNNFGTFALVAFPDITCPSIKHSLFSILKKEKGNWKEISNFGGLDFLSCRTLLENKVPPDIFVDPKTSRSLDVYFTLDEKDCQEGYQKDCERGGKYKSGDAYIDSYVCDYKSFYKEHLK